MSTVLEKIVGTKQSRDLKAMIPLVRDINDLESEVLVMPSETFPQETDRLRARLA